jgi:hypothetical protein
MSSDWFFFSIIVSRITAKNTIATGENNSQKSKLILRLTTIRFLRINKRVAHKNEPPISKRCLMKEAVLQL